MDDFQNFSLHVSITEQDYRDYNVYYLLHMNPGKRTILLCRIIVFVFLLFYLVFTAQLQDPFAVVFCVVFAVLFCLFAPKLMARITNRNIDRMKKVGKLMYDTEADITFERDRIVTTTKNSYVAYPREDVTRVIDLPEVYYLFVGAASAIVIPKRNSQHCDAQLRAYFNL